MIRIISKLIILPVFFSTLVSCKTEVIIPVERNYKQIFSDSSFWNRPIMPDAQYSDIQDVLMNIPEQAPTRLFMETVAFLIVNPTAPLVNIKSSQGFEYPFRTQEKGSTMAQFHLESDAGVTECNAKGNGHFGIYDTNTGTIYQGCAMWRNQGSNTLLSAHVSDRFNTNITSGDGTKGYRAAGFSALGGVLLSGEMNNGIKHCLSVLVNARQLYANQFFTWPATSADGHAPDPVTGYQGTNPNYKMGTKAGAETVALTTNNIPAHTHEFEVANLPGAAGIPTNRIAIPTSSDATVTAKLFSTDTNNTTTLAPTMLDSAGGNIAHANMQPFLVINYCIALNGNWPSRP